MNPSARFALMAGAVALFTACGSQPPIGSTGLVPTGIAVAAEPDREEPSGYMVLASFDGTTSKNPYAALLALNGTLYGTTSGGYDGSQALGDVFSVTTLGAEKVLYNFRASPDANDSVASLIAIHSRLYGTAAHGGTYNGGAVFTVSRTGKERVLYSFGGVNDGAVPTAALISVNGTLYGTTNEGQGSSGSGTIFSVTKDGVETVLHRFAAYPNDGAWPQAGLTYANGLFYGVTTAGGTVQYGNHGAGTVFSLTSGGTEKVLYSFNPRSHDGYAPWGGLTSVNGALYGTTSQGGRGCGTVFTITRTGVEKILHSFGQHHDGCIPKAELLNVKGKLYGTTSDGGEYGQGTIYSISPNGKETVVHSFGSGTDGSHPIAGLINVKGTLYGTTTFGGANSAGIVFAMTP